MPKRKIDQAKPNFKRKAEYDATTFKILKTPHVFDSKLCEGIPRHELEETLQFYLKCCAQHASQNPEK
jgi:hypothetical protein